VDLPLIPGIEPGRLGLLSQGDGAFLRRLLRGFVIDTGPVPQQVQADLDGGAHDTAAERLHRLRGAAANLGALDLAHSIRELEEAIQTGRPTVTALLARFSSNFDDLLSAIASCLEVPDPSMGPLPTAPAAAPVPLDEAKLAELRAALTAHKPRPARRLFAELEAGLVEAYGPTAIQSLTEALDTLRFDEALALLKGCRRS
jgi:HPt (histidine-containing phosphotransfer) domain-containing protein